MRSNLTIDLRMYQMSGIGRYLQLLMPVLVPLLEASRINILGDPLLLSSQIWAQDPRIQIVPHRARIFSVPEQLAGLGSSIRNAAVLWSPQYNIPLLYSGKLIVTIHDLCQLAYPETLANSLQRWYSRHLMTQAVSRAEAILCVSEFTANEVQRLLDVDPARITVTYPQLGDYTTNSAKPLRSQRPYFLAVGNIKKHKNLGTLISAFNQIKSQIYHDLVIVGRQEGFLNVDNKLSGTSNSPSDRIRFTGFVPEEALYSHYRNAEALVFPSFYEGFGFPLVEAMAQGCAVACSNAASLPEVANDAALLFDPFNVMDISSALLRLANDTTLRANLIERGFSRLSSLKAQSGAKKTAHIINSIIDNQQ